MKREQLEKELTATKKGLEKAKERTSTLRGELRTFKEYQNGLIWQYERVVKEYRKMLESYKNNLTKMFFISLFLKIKGKIGGDR